MITRHPILRSAFVWQGVSRPVQVVLETVDAGCECVDLQTEADPAAAFRALREREHARGFELACAPLLRLTIAELAPDRHQLLWTSHHLLLDGWSNARLIGELLRAYSGAADAKEPPPFRRYIEWLNARPQEASEQFFRARLAQLDEPTRLASSIAPRSRGEGRGVLRQKLSEETTAFLRNAAQAERITLNTLVQAAWSWLLSTYTGKPVVCFGTAVAGRPSSLPESELMLGMFINTLPCVLRVGGSHQPVAEFLRALQDAFAAAREHEHTPLYTLQRWAGLPGRTLFDTLLVFENYPTEAALAQAGSGLSFGPVHSFESTNYPLAVSVSAERELTFAFEYGRAEFDDESVARIAERLFYAIEQLASQPSRPFSQLELFDLRDQAEFAALAPPPTPALETAFVHTALTARAQAMPHACAVTCAGRSLTFLELETQANRLAQRLAQHGVGPERLVGVGLPRSPELIVALLAVLKAGAAYVPLDPSYPLERLSFMREDAGLTLIITNEPLRARFAQLGNAALVCTDDPTLAREPKLAPATALRPKHAAYLIYTSGSTGRPKGVTVAHDALAMHCAAARALYGLSEHDCALHLASISFDAAVEQWLVPLLSGSRLILSSDTMSSAEELLELVEREHVSLIYPPTSHLLGLAQLLAEQKRTLDVRLCTVGGEAVSRDTITRLRAALRPERIINGYGPTETVITPLLWQAHGDTPCETAYAPIGTVVGARTAYLLDADLKRVPNGLVGELYIGGSGLAQGYHARSALSAERFLPDPFVRGGRMYRTGDLVRRLASGAFEFVGRADQQIKLRGFRIEPGEIEDALRALPGVSDALVAVHEMPHKQLIGYVASAGDEASLLAALRSRLPEHMVPARLMLLEALPRTPNGKVDRARLPSPVHEQRRFEPPRGEREQQLAALFAQLLGGERVGRDDNFFALGGDSIVSIQLVSRARKLGLAITPRQVFQHQTVQALARIAGSVEQAAVVHGPVEGELPLTPIQAAFFALSVPARHHFNQSLLLAPRAALDVGALKRALGVVLRHHDALRLRFTRSGARVTQRYQLLGSDLADDLEPLLWQRRARDGAELEALCQAAQRSLRLDEGPLLRALHVSLADGSERLLLVVHHLVIDGVSFRILLDDLEQAYGDALAGRATELVRTSSYQTWSLLLQQYANEEAQRDLPYWERSLGGAAPLLPRTGTASHAPVERTTRRLRFDPAFTARLLRDAGRAYRMRIDELLLTALTRAFCAFSGHDALRVELEGHGREELSREVDTSRTLGWFTSCFPVQLPHAHDLHEALVGVKECLRALPRRGLGFGVLKYLAAEPVRTRIQALAPAEVQFNYLGQFDQSFGSEHALFSPASESSGDEHDPSLPLAHRFAIGGEIYGGALRLSFTYAPRHDSDEAVVALIASFERELSALVDHCEAQTDTVLTPTDVPLAQLDRGQLERALADKDDVTDLYRLTPMQEGMLFHAVADGAHDVYVTQLSAEVRGLDVARFCAAWQDTLDAHESLRSSFVLRGLPHPVQRVHARVTLPFCVLSEREAELASIAERERATGFDLAHAPLMRIVLIEGGPGLHQMIWTSHHLLLDGWSSSLLFGEVLQRYHGTEVKAPRARFRDYVAWLARQDRARSEAFFRARLAELETSTLLASALPKPRVRANEHASFRLRVPEQTTRALEVCSQAARVTLHTAVQAALSVLLQRLTGQRAVAFGSTVAGRPADLPEVEQLLGLFINTLPVVVAPAAHQSVVDFLHSVQAAAVELREHEHAPLYEVQRWAGFDGPLFDTLLVFENYPVAQALGEQCGTLSFRTASSHETTNYPLTIGVTHGKTLDLTFDYQEQHFDARAIERIAHALGRLIEQIAERPDAKLGSLSLAKHAAESAPGPTEGCPCVLTRIAQQARARPRDVALFAEGIRITYAELAQRTAVLTNRLLQLGVEPQQLVGVVVERTPAALVALLSVLQAGAAFVALDPGHPDAYLVTLQQRAKLRVVLGPAGQRARFEKAEPCIYVASEPTAAAHAETRLHAVPRTPLSDDGLAYVLYTSGSTGLPKGVEVTRAALSRQCDAAAQLLGLDERDRVLLFASLAFDASLEQWLVALSRGATVHVMESVWSPARLLREIAARGLTRIDLPPAYALAVARELEQRDERLAEGALRSCTVGGEAISSAGLRRVGDRLRPAQLINAYGPTEAVITPTAWIADAQEIDADAHAPIGTPLAERVAYVLDGSLAELPSGAVGELYLGGGPLARGYRDEPARTAERFVPDPFGAPGARMLRTGDLVRRDADGVLAFVGRADDQIKLRGYRVEVGEVLAALHAHPQVRDAAVVARGAAADVQLVAYVEVDQGAEANLEAVQAYLRARLPPHAVPAQLIPLATIPRTQNGKVDTRALPAFEPPLRVPIAPRTSLEQQLARAFAAVLDKPVPSVHDNFFALGGHSLRALALIAEVEREAGLTLQLSDLMQHPTVAELAQRLSRVGDPTHSTPVIRLNEASERAPLFCIHPAGGATFAYLPLARALAAQRPVCGVVCRSLLDAQHRDVSLAQLGRDYADLITAVQPDGPYLLLGWSLGGAIALQLAAELEARGKDVQFLGLVDSFVPGFDDLPDEAPFEAAAEKHDGSPFGEEERQRGESTLAHLSALSRSFVLPRVRVRPHCWWSAEGRALRSQVESQLVSAIGVTPHWQGELAVSHEAVIRDPDFLDALVTRLLLLMRNKETLHEGQ